MTKDKLSREGCVCGGGGMIFVEKAYKMILSCAYQQKRSKRFFLKKIKAMGQTTPVTPLTSSGLWYTKVDLCYFLRKK